MASVVALDPTLITVCPGEPVLITATTDPPDESVEEWLVDGQPATNTGPGPNVFRFVSSSTGGASRTLTAQLDGTSQTVTIKVLGLSLALEPAPGDGSRYTISEEPTFPTVAFTAGGDLAPPDSWRIQLFRDISEDCPPHAAQLDDDPLEMLFPGLASIELDFNDPVLMGRAARIEATVSSPCEIVAARTILFAGTNPARTDVDSALPHDALRAIACRESGKRQFDAPTDGGVGRCPYYRRRGRVGVMGIEDASVHATWDWKENVRLGIERFNELLAEAEAYPRQVATSGPFLDMVAQFNDLRVSQGLVPISDVSVPSFTIGDLDANPLQREQDAVRGYDGWYGEDGFGLPLHEFRIATKITDDGLDILSVIDIDEAAGTGSVEWERVPTAERPPHGNPGYVQEVLELLQFGCGSTNSPSKNFKVDIVTDGPERNFATADGVETFVAMVTGDASDLTFSWGAEPFDDVLQAQQTQMVASDTTDELAITLRARHPNKARLQIVARDADGNEDKDTVNISVPQFFHVVFVDDPSDTEHLIELHRDLEMLGLRHPNPTFDPAIAAVNFDVQQRIIDTALEFARSLLPGVNARFVTNDPSNIVLPQNVTTIEVGGADPRRHGAGKIPRHDQRPRGCRQPARARANHGVDCGASGQRDGMVTGRTALRGHLRRLGNGRSSYR